MFQLYIIPEQKSSREKKRIEKLRFVQNWFFGGFKELSGTHFPHIFEITAGVKIMML